MRTVGLSLLVPSFLITATLLWPYFANGQESADAIIQHSAEVNERDWAAAPKFDNSERDRTKDGDRTYAVTMLGGSPYERLITVNGKALSGAKQKQEEETRRRKIREGGRRAPARIRGRAVAENCQKYHAERKRDHTLIRQMISAFDYHLIGQRSLNGF